MWSVSRNDCFFWACSVLWIEVYSEKKEHKTELAHNDLSKLVQLK